MSSQRNNISRPTQPMFPLEAPGKWERQVLESEPVEPLDVPIVSKVILSEIPQGKMDQPFEDIELEITKDKK